MVAHDLPEALVARQPQPQGLNVERGVLVSQLVAKHLGEAEDMTATLMHIPDDLAAPTRRPW